MVRRIAHVSDVHLLDPHTLDQGARYRLATKMVSMGRAIDPEGRSLKLLRALLRGRKEGADHFVISGDLTEVGSDREFELFAQVLHEADLPIESVTIVPGNHDAYTTPDGWRRALRGPLRAFAGSSAGHEVRRVDRDNVVFLPIDSTRFQSIVRSGGEVTRGTAEALAVHLADPSLRNKAVVLVQHHPPFVHRPGALWQWIDGLRGCSRLLEILVKHPNVQILHGHLHKVVDRFVGLGKHRVFGAPATVDDAEGAPRVRLYDVLKGSLVPRSTG